MKVMVVNGIAWRPASRVGGPLAKAIASRCFKPCEYRPDDSEILDVRPRKYPPRQGDYFSEATYTVTFRTCTKPAKAPEEAG